MAESRPGGEIDERLEREADAMEARIDQLDDHIDEAERKAEARREESQPLEDTAGDWNDERPDRPGGDDPEGAVDGDPEAGGSSGDPAAGDARADDT
jgi:hypothetical protein